MPRIYKGQKWEVQYRRDVRSIKDGLTASKNGRGEIKATQLLLKDPDSDKQIAVCWAKNLPWTKKDSSRNLEIIKNAFNLMDESTNLDFKKAIDLSANKYDLSILNKTHSKLNKTMKTLNKQEWIKEEHQKAVQIHWNNIDRIKKLKDEQSTKIYIFPH